MNDASNSRSASSKPCEYSKLETSNNIRLIYLRSGPYDEELYGEVIDANLDDDQSYAALSYVWGQPVFNHRLFTPAGDYYSITESLWQALREIRRMHGGGEDEAIIVLWADGLCINQKDISEREHQVTLMGRIYSQAAQVVTYIGPSTKLTSRGIEIAMNLVNFAVAKLKAGEGPVIIDEMDDIIQKADLPQATDEAWQGLSDLLHRVWSRRIWILQESLLNDSMSMICGSFAIPYWNLLPYLAQLLFRHLDPDLARLAAYSGQEGNEDLDSGGLQSIFALRNGWPVRTGQTLHFYLFACHSLLASDPRDKVYALLGLADSTCGIIPNYRKSAEQVYIETALAIIRQYQSLDILTCVYSERKLSLPSWVPDWSYLPETAGGNLRNRQYCACGATTPQYWVESTLGTIKIRCLLVDEIQSHTDRIKDEALEYAKVTCSFKTPCKSLAHWQKHVVKEAEMVSEVYPGGGSYGEATWRTLVANLAEDDEGAEEAPQSIAEVIAFDDDSHDTDVPVELEQAVAALTRNFQIFASERVLYRTVKGYIGLAPLNTRKGDRLAVLLGGRTPYIIRKEGAVYRFIGEAYAHGLMKGEAFNIEGVREEDILIA